MRLQELSASDQARYEALHLRVVCTRMRLCCYCDRLAAHKQSVFSCVCV